MLTPGEKWAEMDAALHGDLGTILERAGSGSGKRTTDIPQNGMSVSAVAGQDLNLRSSRHWSIKSCPDLVLCTIAPKLSPRHFSNSTRNAVGRSLDRIVG